MKTLTHVEWALKPLNDGSKLNESGKEKVAISRSDSSGVKDFSPKNSGDQPVFYSGSHSHFSM